MGNICRSPTAEGVFRHLADREGVLGRLRVDSAGIGDWHVGQGADPRTLAALSRAGYDGNAHRARQL
ncbi:MAG TPA: low molecular weight phosphotyrosine protein phosphatase, partial [Casimicrobiaceae bacterium]